MDIFNFLNKDERFVLEVLKKTFSRKGIKCYLVGGVVRDFLLNTYPKDIDICVENDLEDFIYEIPYVKQIKYHERFKTSTLWFNNNIQIDIIRCRKEIYKQNGDLPKVYPSNIEDDLKRRDFTVNAIAYDILNEKLLDPFGGIKDIEFKNMRKIKNNSYKEDPTRIFRAIRYAERYGFNIIDEKEIIKCIHEQVLSTISNDRIVKEIILMAKEEKWNKMFKRCSYLNIINLRYDIVYKQKLLNEKLQDRLCYIYKVLNNNWLKYVLQNNSVLDINLKNAFINHKKVEKDLLEATNNYDIFRILNYCNKYEILLLSYNQKLSYKIINYIRMKNEYCNIKAKDLLDLGFVPGKLLGNTMKYIDSIRLNSSININTEYLINSIGDK